nr:transposase [Flavobacteriales bacterium]
MSLRTIHSSESNVFFCTFTCWNWLPLIAETDLYDAVYTWMGLAHEKGYRILGYVIMPNHVHLLLLAPEDHRINTLLANAKRFLAYEAVRRLQCAGNMQRLEALAAATRTGDRERGQKHRVFSTSSDIRECTDEAMMHQKLDYIHANPVCGKWSLVDDPVDYPHSSLSFYTKGVSTFAPITHVGLALHG